jgi:hypothetical protein
MGADLGSYQEEWSRKKNTSISNYKAKKALARNKAET